MLSVGMRTWPWVARVGLISVGMGLCPPWCTPTPYLAHVTCLLAHVLVLVLVLVYEYVHVYVPPFRCTVYIS